MRMWRSIRSRRGGRKRMENGEQKENEKKNKDGREE